MGLGFVDELSLECFDALGSSPKLTTHVSAARRQAPPEHVEEMPVLVEEASALTPANPTSLEAPPSSVPEIP